MGSGSGSGQWWWYIVGSGGDSGEEWRFLSLLTMLEEPTVPVDHGGSS